MTNYDKYNKLPNRSRTKVEKSEEVEVEFDIYDVVDFIEKCNEEEAEIIVSILEEMEFLETRDHNIDPIYEEVLKSDSWESRDKIAFLKTIFEKTSLEEFKNKLL